MEEGGLDFQETIKLFQRGDIIGIKGFPTRTKPGELSIGPGCMRLLTPCLYMMPTLQYGVKDT